MDNLVGSWGSIEFYTTCYTILPSVPTIGPDGLYGRDTGHLDLNSQSLTIPTSLPERLYDVDTEHPFLKAPMMERSDRSEWSGGRLGRPCIWTVAEDGQRECTDAFYYHDENANDNGRFLQAFCHPEAVEVIDGKESCTDLNWSAIPASLFDYVYDHMVGFMPDQQARSLSATPSNAVSFSQPAMTVDKDVTKSSTPSAPSPTTAMPGVTSIVITNPVETIVISASTKSSSISASAKSSSISPPSTVTITTTVTPSVGAVPITTVKQSTTSTTKQSTLSMSQPTPVPNGCGQYQPAVDECSRNTQADIKKCAALDWQCQCVVAHARVRCYDQCTENNKDTIAFLENKRNIICNNAEINPTSRPTVSVFPTTYTSTFSATTVTSTDLVAQTDDAAPIVMSPFDDVRANNARMIMPAIGVMALGFGAVALLL